MRPIKIQDRILYTQLLTQADYIVHALVALEVLRGGVMALGAFERNGETVERLLIEVRDNAVTIGEQRYSITMLAGGLFSLSEINP